jgi:exosome complex component RRP41
MPLDTSTYNLALLRLDGRRWNELRRLTAQISTQASADGSSYLEMGNTKVICTVTGPAEPKGSGGARAGGDNAEVKVEISVAGFSGVDRKRRGRNDKYVLFLTRLNHIHAQIEVETYQLPYVSMLTISN